METLPEGASEQDFSYVEGLKADTGHVVLTTPVLIPGWPNTLLFAFP